jgi:hypothetical protein
MRIVLFAPLLLVVSSAVAEEVIVRDLRTAKDEGGTCFLVFCARESPNVSGKPGHAYVVWGEESERAQMSIASSFGFYSRDGKLRLGDVPSELKDEAKASAASKSSLLTHRLIVKVDRETFQSTQKLISEWKTNDYNLLERNCVHFTHAVAKAAGLNPPEPPKIPRPSAYFKALFEAEKRMK